MIAVNSAISIDLTGQVSADSIGTRFYSGVGGQMDFMRGAALSSHGRAIIALPSTAAGGRVSRIACVLAEGAGVVTSRAHVRTVVTEYGVAELFGRSVRERAASLIAIAHPDFRDELTYEARRRYHV
jgi:acyl-CoA hydrolase